MGKGWEIKRNWVSFEAGFKVLAHTWFEDVYVVLEPHKKWVDAAEEEDRTHSQCCGLESQLHLLLVLLVEALKPIVLVSGKGKGVMFLVHCIKVNMKKLYYHVCLMEIQVSISYSFLAKIEAFSYVFLLSFTISVGFDLQRGQRMLSVAMRSFMHL